MLPMHAQGELHALCLVEISTHNGAGGMIRSGIRTWARWRCCMGPPGMSRPSSSSRPCTRARSARPPTRSAQQLCEAKNHLHVFGLAATQAVWHARLLARHS